MVAGMPLNITYGALAGIYGIIGVLCLFPAKYADNAVKAQRGYRKAAKKADAADSKKFEEKKQGKKKQKQGPFQKGFLGAGQAVEKPQEIDMLDAFLPGPPSVDAPKIPNNLAALTMLLPVVFLVSACVLPFFPDVFMSLPWAHLLTVVLLWLKWTWSYPPAAPKGKSIKARRGPPGKTVGGVDKGSVYSDTSSDEDDDDEDEEDEVYYAMTKPSEGSAAADADDPVEEDDKEAEEEAVFSL